MVAMVTLMVFLPAVRFPFFPFWDDDIHVHANPHLANLSWESLRALWAGPWQQLYIPLTYTAWAGLAALSLLAGWWLLTKLLMPLAARWLRRDGAEIDDGGRAA
jgi:hypothetical protein